MATLSRCFVKKSYYFLRLAFFLAGFRLAAFFLAFFLAGFFLAGFRLAAFFLAFFLGTLLFSCFSLRSFLLLLSYLSFSGFFLGTLFLSTSFAAFFLAAFFFFLATDTSSVNSLWELPLKLYFNLRVSPPTRKIKRSIIGFPS